MVTDGPRPGDEHDDERRGRDQPDGDSRRQQPERNTEPIPTYRGSGPDDAPDYDGGGYGGATGSGPAPDYEAAPDYDSLVEFDDIEFAALTQNQSGVGFAPNELVPTREPSELVRRYLFPTEKFRGEWRRHWIHLIKRFCIGILATFILGYLAGYFAKKEISSALTILVIIWIVVMSWVLWDIAEWYYDRFILTNKRVMLIEGIISRKVAMMPLARVTDMKYTQSPLGRVLGYGTFEIESAGQDQALRNVNNLPNPTDLYLQVVEEMYEPEASEARRRPAKIDDGL